MMHRQASFFAAALSTFGRDLDDYATFRFPSVDGAFDDAMVGGGTYVAALNDRKVVADAIKLMLSPKWGRVELATNSGLNGWLVPNLRFKEARHTDDLVRSWLVAGHQALASGQFRFDASDTMPTQVGAGTFWSAIVDLVAGLKTIPQVLAEIDASWPMGP